MKREDALIVMAWLAAHPNSGANALGRLVTDGGTPHQVSGRGWRIAADLRRFGYVERTIAKGRMLYSLTPEGRRVLKAP